MSISDTGAVLSRSEILKHIESGYVSSMQPRWSPLVAKSSEEISVSDFRLAFDLIGDAKGKFVRKYI